MSLLKRVVSVEFRDRSNCLEWRIARLTMMAG